MNKTGLQIIEADSLEQVKGKCLYPLVTEEYEEAFKKMVSDVFEGKSRSLEFRASGLHKQVVWLYSKSVPIRDRDGNIISMLSVTDDITERRKAEEQLRTQATLLDASSDVILVIDMRGEFMYFNKALPRLTGYTAEELLERNLHGIEPPEYAEKILANVKMLAERGEAVFESAYLHKDGRVIPIEVHAKIIEADGNKVIISAVRDITERRSAQDALLKSEKQYRMLFESNPHPMWVYEIDTLAFLTVNAAAVKKYGYSRDEFLNMTIKDIRPTEDVSRLVENVANVSGGIDYAGIWKHRKKDGTIIDVEIISHELEYNGKRAELVMANDVTEHRKLEEQLRQSQKMETVGNLAGGVAHDFNNILMAIIGFGHIAVNNLKSDPATRELVEEMLAGADRASELTRSLLAFSRKQVFEIKPIELNESITNLKKMLERIIGEHIELDVKLTDKPLNIMADKGQIEQILINLATNAKDAMPEGGKITISTEIIEIDGSFIKAYDYGKPGKYAKITLTDSGKGIDKDIQDRIFEPFFTTKEIGKGTGLGLSICYGIVTQHNGYIKLYSEPGKGTTFRIYLPLIDVKSDELFKEVKTDRNTRGTETILVAEDDYSLRNLSKTIIESYGYTVITAENGEDAIEKFRENKEKIKLFISDVIMPKMSGKDAYEKIRAISPDVRVLFLSGYTMDTITTDGLQESGCDFMNKPVIPKKLVEKVREILDRQLE